MKKRTLLTIITVFVFLFCGCAKKTDSDLSEQTKWDCTVLCAEKSKSNSYIITYSPEKVVCNTGKLSVQNDNDFDITVYLSTNDEDERVEKISANTTSVLSSVKEEAVYTVGVHADVEEDTKISCIIYDGGLQESSFA